jgi:hypothetical protein
MKNVFFMAVLAVLGACSRGNKSANIVKEEEKKSSGAACCSAGSLAFDNAAFYAADGTFNEEAARDAVVRLMERYHYPVTGKTRDQLWVSDYGTGRFTEVGLAAIMHANDTVNRYMLQDLFLLPNQMLPEHWHEKPAGLPAKMEGWLVRAGSSYIVGEGEDNLAAFPAIKIPACHAGGVTVKHVVEALPGDFVHLSRVYSRHWQFAGPGGAIITEVANVHDGASVRHQVAAINDFFLGKP